jgi:hypothetical protein
MFCPRCGQERVTEETSFCSRCGFLLTGAADLLLTDGVMDAKTAMSTLYGTDSPRRRGFKTGLFMILLMIVLAPVIGIVMRFGLNMMPWPVGVVVFLLGGGGLLRIIYALFFESGSFDDPKMQEKAVRAGKVPPELPVADLSSFIPPPPVGAGNWLDTNDLEPRSVTDATTQLLEKEQEPFK